MISRMRKRPPKRRRRSHSATAVVASLLDTAEAVESRLEAAVSPLGLSLAKLGVLHPLAEAREPLPLSELAQRTHCVRSNITQLVDRLEKGGLVRRRPDPDDRRGVLAALTPAGEQALRVQPGERGHVRRIRARRRSVRVQPVHHRADRRLPQLPHRFQRLGLEAVDSGRRGGRVRHTTNSSRLSYYTHS